MTVLQVCWISYTYYIPDNQVAGQPGALKQHLNYYQWVPIVLLVQAFLFYLPSLLWQVFSERSGININNLVEAAETIQVSYLGIVPKIGGDGGGGIYIADQSLFRSALTRRDNVLLACLPWNQVAG